MQTRCKSKKFMEFPDIRLLVFAKAPIENQVKTRLIPTIGVEKATEIYRFMVQQTVSMAVDSALCPVQLWCAPNNEHPFFSQLQKEYNISLYMQQGAHLGERMFHAAAHALQSCSAVFIIGCDCLQLTSTYLQSAMASLTQDDKDVAITPALDGGYVLIGMKSADKYLFENINWGSDLVMQQTRSALQNLGWMWEELQPLRDFDTVDDLLDIKKHPQNYQLSHELNNVVNILVNNR